MSKRSPQEVTQSSYLFGLQSEILYMYRYEDLARLTELCPVDGAGEGP